MNSYNSIEKKILGRGIEQTFLKDKLTDGICSLQYYLQYLRYGKNLSAHHWKS